jgi:hypothetical protein
MKRFLIATLLLVPFMASSCGMGVDHGQVISDKCVDDPEGSGSFYLKMWEDGYTETHTPRNWTCAEFYDENYYSNGGG